MAIKLVNRHNITVKFSDIYPCKSGLEKQRSYTSKGRPQLKKSLKFQLLAEIF